MMFALHPMDYWKDQQITLLYHVLLTSVASASWLIFLFLFGALFLLNSSFLLDEDCLGEPIELIETFSDRMLLVEKKLKIVLLLVELHCVVTLDVLMTIPLLISIICMLLRTKFNKTTKKINKKKRYLYFVYGHDDTLVIDDTVLVKN